MFPLIRYYLPSTANRENVHSLNVLMYLIANLTFCYSPNEPWGIEIWHRFPALKLASALVVRERFKHTILPQDGTNMSASYMKNATLLAHQIHSSWKGLTICKVWSWVARSKAKLYVLLNRHSTEVL